MTSAPQPGWQAPGYGLSRLLHAVPLPDPPPGPVAAGWRLPAARTVLLAGDVHADLEHWEYLIDVAAEHHVDGIVQLGDFGYLIGFTHRDLAELDRMLADAGLWVLWCDGNHDHHPRLRDNYPWRDTPTSVGVTPMTSTVFHAHRGARWTWSGMRWGALGGAYSIDRATRELGVDWFEEEATTGRDLARLMTPAPLIGHNSPTLDVLITHECPAGVDLDLPALPARLATLVAGGCRDQRDLLRRAVYGTRPRLVFHGHHHRPSRGHLTLPDGSRSLVYGLSHNRDATNSWLVYKLSETGSHAGEEGLPASSAGQTEHPARSDTTRKCPDDSDPDGMMGRPHTL